MGKEYKLFNSNGNFGKGIKHNPYYDDTSEIIAQMDRLGVSRSLVWYTEARDYNCAWGNRKLIEEINASGAKNRLIPAFTISAAMYYEDGALDELLEGMKKNNVRALRAFPGSLRHRIRQLEPIINALAELKPVLFFDSKDSVDFPGFLEFAGRYPDIPMVYMQGMWTDLATMLDLLRSRKNILVDISWLHTPGTIEMMVEEFGAERILFGMGLKSQNGASIGALLHADIDEEARERIAHKNLDELLGISPTEACCRVLSNTAAGKQSLWDKFLDEKNIGIDIIDAHGHLGASNSAIFKINTIQKQVGYISPIMDKFNIKKMIVSSMQATHGNCVEGNRALEKELEYCNNNHFSGYLAFNPIYASELAPLFDEFFSREFYVGFKLLCDYWAVPLTDPRFIPVWEYADRHCLPILLHTWDGDYDSPAMLTDIVPNYPNAIFLLGHSGGGDDGRREAIELVRKHDNVYLEFCGSFTSSITWEETLEKVNNDHVVFGTDALFHNPVWELSRLLSTDVPDETIIPILSGNMQRILGLRK